MSQKKTDLLKDLKKELYLQRQRDYQREKRKNQNKVKCFPQVKRQKSSVPPDFNQKKESTKRRRMKNTSKVCSTEKENSQTMDRDDFEAANNFHESPTQSQLEQYLNQIQIDFNIDADGSVPPEEEVKKHERRMGQIAVDWDEHWDGVVDGLIASYATIPSLCWICKKSLTACYTRCLCCVKTYCQDCDLQFHSWNVFHRRQLLFQDSQLIQLKPNEFWDQTLAVVVTKEIAVPCFVPPQCQSCLSVNSLTIEPLKNKNMIVVTLLGRFDLSAASFKCHNPSCGKVNEASVEDYVSSGYWPGSPTRTCTLFTQSYLTHWYHTKHQIASTAAIKYIEVSGKMSSEDGRNPVINPIMFRTAATQFSYIQHKIDIEVKQEEKMRCKACVSPCMYCHFDVIFKLYRFKSARSGHFKSLYEDAVIVSDSKMNKYVEEINKLKPQKGFDNCGKSTYKAGKENTSRHRTQDETGFGSACCRHGVVLVTANLKTGENYRVVNFFQHFLWTLGYVYFCYDVICNYEKFLKDLIKVSEQHELHEEWLRMSQEMTGFLSVLHGRTHTWDCQVDNNGRWREWACASLGEEQEQVFSRFARYGSVTKHMSPASRNDHLSEMVEYHNKEKDDGMDQALVKRAKKANFKQVETETKLAALLSKRGLTEKDLPGILTKLQDLSNQKKKNEGDSDVKNPELGVLVSGTEAKSDDDNAKEKKEKKIPNSFKADLEGFYMTAAWARKMMSKYGDTTAERDKFRFKVQDANGKATALMTLINQQSKYQITREMYSTGSFPWNETAEINLTANYNLIDTWMMSKRWKEEISQTKYEMKNYLESLAEIHLKLKEDISIHTAIVESWQESSGKKDFFQYPQSIQMARGKIVIITLELNRIIEKVARAVSLFKMYIHGSFNFNSDCDTYRDCDQESDSESHQDSNSDCDQDSDLNSNRDGSEPDTMTFVTL